MSAQLLRSQAAGAGDERPAETAKALVKTGIEHFNAQDYEGARAAFAHAYEMAADSATLVNLALAELQSGHPADAARLFRRYLNLPAATPETRAAIASKWLPRAEAQASRVRVIAPAGSDVLVDGKNEGQAPIDVVDVSAGTHDLTVQDRGWTHSTHVTTRPAELLVVQLGAHASVRTETAAVGPPPSEHPTSWPQAKTIAEIALVTGAAVSLTSGLVFAVDSRRALAEAAVSRAELPSDSLHPHSQCVASPPPPECATLQEESQAAVREANWSRGLYVAAGVLAVGALAAWVLWPAPTSSGTLAFARSMTPVANRDHIGVDFQGIW
jgi:tetratricopeptide (TPR) repeat protein